jgi:toxin YoeB
VKLTFEEAGWEQYLALRASNPKTHTKLDALIAECLRHPFKGTGKPEPLKRNLQGYWSRRITREHRLVYRVEGSGAGQTLIVAQCLYHYE